MEKLSIMVVTASTASRVQISYFLQKIIGNTCVSYCISIEEAAQLDLKATTIIFGPDDFDFHQSEVLDHACCIASRVVVFVRPKMVDRLPNLVLTRDVAFITWEPNRAGPLSIIDQLGSVLGSAKSRVSTDDDPASPIPFIKAIGVGASTGGIAALETLFSKLVPQLPPILIVQHTKSENGRGIARLLDKAGPVIVLEAEHGIRPEPGHAYIAGDRQKHLTLSKRSPCMLEQRAGASVCGHRPSVDMLFSSMAHLGERALGIILTGMGRDGAEGLKAMRDNGSWTIGQNAQSALVYGMPKAAVELGAVCEEMSLDQIARRLCQTQSACVQ